jgi:phospholipase C
MKPAFAIVMLAFMTACGSIALHELQDPVSGPAPASSPIKHVVVILKQGHSFDNYFGQFPGANGATSGGSTIQINIPLLPMSNSPETCGQSWNKARGDIDDGLMNGFYANCGNTYNAYVQAQPSLIPNYWSYAQTYGLADNFFAQMTGPSFPNRMYVFSESSGNAIGVPNISDGNLYGLGCDAAAQGANVRSINSATGKYYYQPSCFEMKTMGDVLDAGDITWRIYSPQPGASGYQGNFGSYYSNLWYGSQRNSDVDDTQFCADIGNSALPQVSWITAPQKYSDIGSIPNGEGWTVDQINCLMNSPYWSSTLILVVWDEWGGFYDHVAPPDTDYFGYGMRVPLLVISPYVKPGHIGHVQYSFDSINKEIESIFSLPCLLSDCSNSVNDLNDMLTATPAAPTLIISKKSPLQ